jgi:hypothetical protein
MFTALSSITHSAPTQFHKLDRFPSNMTCPESHFGASRFFAYRPGSTPTPTPHPYADEFTQGETPTGEGLRGFKVKGG